MNPREKKAKTSGGYPTRTMNSPKRIPPHPPTRFLWAAALCAALLWAGPSPGTAAQGSPLTISPPETGSDGKGGAPLGEGGFDRSPVRITAGVRQGYNSNVSTSSTNPDGSVFTAINAGASYFFGGSRLALSTSLSGDLSYYYSAPPSSTWLPNLSWNLGGTYEATRRLTLSASTLTSYLSQGASNLYGAPTSNVGEYFYSDSELAAEYRWSPKLSTVTSYSPLFVAYANQTQQDLVGRVEQTVGQQIIHLWKPQTGIVAEYRFNARNYFVNTSLDSWGNILLLGINHTFNPKSKLVVRAGAEQRMNGNPYGGQDPYLGPYGELEFNYALGNRTSVSLYSRYGTSASGLGDINQSQQLMAGLSVQREITARISARAYVNYQNNRYDQPGAPFAAFGQNVYSAGLGASYAINRNWGLNAGYEYNGAVSGDQAQTGNYSQNIVFIGAQTTFGGPKGK